MRSSSAGGFRTSHHEHRSIIPQNRPPIEFSEYHQKGVVEPPNSGFIINSVPLHIHTTKQFLPLFIAWHCCSVLALAALLFSGLWTGAMGHEDVQTVLDDPTTSGVGSGTGPDRETEQFTQFIWPKRPFDDMKRRRSENYRETFNDWLLRVSKNASRTHHSEQCLRLDRHRVHELCQMPSTNRIRRLRKVYFDVSQGLGLNHTTGATHHSPGLPRLPGMTMYELFLLELCNVTKVEDFTSIYNLETLQYNATKCVYSDVYSECIQCFDDLLTNLERLELEVIAFGHILAQYSECSNSDDSDADADADSDTPEENDWQDILDFDAPQLEMQFDDFASIDPEFETFSSMSDCENCRKGYLLWLLVQHMSTLWNRTLCSNWCVIAELTCPHIRTTHKTDYAGFPMFRCHDPEIGDAWTENVGGEIVAFDQTQNDDCHCVDACQFHQYLIQVFTGGPEDQYLPESVVSPYRAVHNVLLQCNNYKTRCPFKPPPPAPASVSKSSCIRSTNVWRTWHWSKYILCSLVILFQFLRSL